MAQKRGGLSSPFSTPFKAPPKGGKGTPGTYDRNTTPVLGEKREYGPNGVTTIFFSDIKGHPAGVSTPMQKTLAQGTAAVDKRK